MRWRWRVPGCTTRAGPGTPRRSSARKCRRCRSIGAASRANSRTCSAQRSSGRVDVQASHTNERPAMDLELQGKRALVTGGSRGIGKAIARLLAEEGADVALLARTADALDAAAAELAAATGRSVVGVRADTTSDAQVREAVAQAVQQLGGPIDILVNAAAEPAGYAAPPKLGQIEAGFFHAEMDAKVMGYVR